MKGCFVKRKFCFLVRIVFGARDETNFDGIVSLSRDETNLDGIVSLSRDETADDGETNFLMPCQKPRNTILILCGIGAVTCNMACR